MKIHIKNSSDNNLSLPVAATPKSSGYDIVALEDPKIVGEKNEFGWKSIDYIEYHTGLHIAPQTDRYNHDYHTLIFPRSSISKYNLVLANSVPVIDNDFRGEILLRFKYIFQPSDFMLETVKSSTSDSDDSFTYSYTGQIVGKVNEDKIYKKFDRIAQLVAEVLNPIEWVVVADLSATIRGEGGFGSSSSSTINTNNNKNISTDTVNNVITERIIPPSKLAIKFKEATHEIPPITKYESAIREREKAMSK